MKYRVILKQDNYYYPQYSATLFGAHLGYKDFTYSICNVTSTSTAMASEQEALDYIERQCGQHKAITSYAPKIIECT